MKHLDIIAACKQKNIKLALKEDRLVLVDEQKNITPDLLAELKKYKADIIAWLQQSQASSSSEIPAVSLEHYPLSFAQQRLWLVDQISEGSSQYNIAMAFKLTGALDKDIVARVFSEIVGRHTILRSVFVMHDEGPRQVVQDAQFCMDYLDFTALSDDKKQDKLAEKVTSEANYVFDLEHDLMLRATLVALSETEHAILLTMHHIAFDGWSTGILLKEFITLYQSFSAGENSPLPQLPIQYSDFAHWQRHTLDAGGNKIAKELSYWKQNLDGAPSLHSLPLDRSRPARQDFRAGVFSHKLSAALTQQIKALMPGRDTSLFMVLQSAFVLFLARWSQERDIVISSAIAGRNNKQVESLIGMFINTLVYRTQLSNEMTFEELLTLCKSNTLAAFENQNISFDALVEELNPQRDMSYPPISQISFAFNNNEVGEISLPELSIERLSNDDGVVKYELELHLKEMTSEQGSELLFNWTYARSLFDEASIARMASGFESLLRSIVARPDGLLSEFAIQSEADAERMLKQGEGRHNSEGRHQTLVSCFEAQVAQTPDAVAVWYQEESGECSSLSYRDLNRYANQLADYLSEQGSGVGDFVAVYVSRSVELLVGLLGVLKAGAAYIPIEPSSKPARISQLLEDAGVELVLTSAGMLSGLPIASVDVLMLDDVVREGALSDYADSNPEPVATLTDSAYVIYTSGSTGTPKGVEVSHGGLVDYLAFGLEAYYPTGGDGSLVVTSHGFDISIPGLFLPLMQGGCVRLLSVGDELNHLATELHQGDSHRYLIRMTPMHVKGLLSLMDADSTVTAEHVFVIGGEALSVRDARQLQARFPGSQIYNHYGPTETVVGCSLFDFSAQADNLDEGAVSVPIGRAMDNTRLYVLDSERQVCAEGMVGELYVGGPCVAKGYLNRPALTSERFIASPFVAGERLYRTGDLVRWQAGVSDAADSQLVFVGRADEQVKIRGYRIEPGEVSSLIKAHPGVSDAVVVVSGEGEQARLVAYVVSQEAEEESALIQDISHALGQVLPEHMIPSGMMLLAALPLTANGKLDRRGLPDIAQQSEQAYVAPRNELELQLAELWQSLLGVEQVGVNDNFFDLGGHSLLATRMISSIAKMLDKRIPLRTLFNNPSIRLLANELQLKKRETFTAIPLADRREPLPLSFAQQRFWFVDQFEGNSSKYNMPFALKMTGQLNYTAMQRALDTLLERHEILRTVYRDEQQLINPASALDIHRIDLREEAVNDSRLRHFAEEEAAKPFDLSQHHMLRCSLLVLAEQEHVLLFTLHHIATDGWSNAILAKEFVALYGAFAQEQQSPLSPVPLQYADFASWQRNTLSGEKLSQELAYWTNKLADLPVVHQLPLDFVRPEQQSFSAGTYTSTLPVVTLKALNQLASRQEASLFMLLQCAWSVLIGRWSNETDIVIGSPIAGRAHASMDNLVGCCINNLIFRTDLSGTPQFLELLSQVKQSTLEAFEHQELPFELLVNELNPERNSSHNPLCQLSFTMHNNEAVSFSLPGIKIDGIERETESVKNDIELHVVEAEDGLMIKWVYADSLFKAETIARMAAGFERMLKTLCQQPHQEITKLPVFSMEEEQRLMSLGQSDATLLERITAENLCLHEYIEKMAALHPDRQAVVFADVTLTYRQLNEKANRLAHYLVEQGAKTDTLVAVCMERSADLVVAILGIMKSGAAYVPIEPTDPEDRIHFMLQDSAANIIVTQSWLLSQIPAYEQKLIPVDGQMGETMLSGYSDDNIKPESVNLTQDNLCYVIYSSGTTGEPKGIEIEHRQIVASTLSRTPFFGGPVERFLTLVPFSFDASLIGLFWSLTSGGTLHVLDADDAKSSNCIINTVEQQKITHIGIPPVLYRTVLAQLEQNGNRKASSLQVIISGGEALDKQLKNLHFQQPWGKNASFTNEYGPTEATVWSTAHQCTEIQSSTSVPIGNTPGHADLIVVDANNALQPLGVTGELLVAGAGVARGYLRNSTLTAEKFISCPSGSQQRVYRTGDLVRWLPQGQLEFIGRIDDQVKIRGFRIELAEIEECLMLHPEVSQAIVIVDTQNHDKRLVAYVVPRTENDDENQEARLIQTLRQHVRSKLPSYMLPSAFVLMATLPVTGNNKVDKKALPLADFQAAQNYVAPETVLQETLVQLWQSLLGLEQVGIEDNFFEIGGHSLMATKMVSEIAHSHNKEVPVKAIFENSTIRTLSAHLEALEETTISDIVPVDRSGKLPLSLGQQSIWFIDQFDNGSAHYNMPMALRLEGQLQLPALQRALNSVLQRHEVLRTVYSSDSAEQIVTSRNSVEIDFIDLSGQENTGTEIKKLVREACTKAFDLSVDSMLRCRLLRIAQEQHILVITLHHIACDGISIGILAKEISALYNACLIGQESPLPPLHLQYGDYVHWQRSDKQTENRASSLAYWQTQLADIPLVHDLPLDKKRPQKQTFLASTVHLNLAKTEFRALQELANSHQVSLFILMQTAFALLISRWSNQDDILIGSPVSGRVHRNLEPLIGYFVNTLVIRSKVKPEQSFKDFLAQNKTTILSGFEHQSVPFEAIVEELNPERSMAHSPLFQILFGLQKAQQSDLSLTNLNVIPEQADSQFVKFDLEVNVTEAAEELKVSFKYAQALFDETTIQRLAESYRLLLNAVVAMPEGVVSELPLLSLKDQQQLNDWNATETDFPDALCLHQLFEAQAVAHPARIATECEGQSLTYRELDARANQLAGFLLARGVQPEAPVALLLDRSLDMIVAIIAVLKSGAAYVPVDPDYPADRIAYMLEDCGANIILTQSPLVALLPANAPDCVELDAPDLLTGFEQKSPDIQALHAGLLANIIYTSGSTGKPKGVMVEHRALVNRIDWMQKQYPLQPDDVVLQKTPYSFDVSVWELLWPLMVGAKQVFAKPQGHKDPEYLKGLLASCEITTLHFVPSMLAIFIEHKGFEFASALRRVFCSGEALGAHLVTQFYQATRDMSSQGVELHNLYGPTEAAIDVSYWDCQNLETSGNVTIGKPIHNIQLHVLDQNQQPVPVCVAGELYIGGIGLARGYVNKPEVTEARFILSPFNETERLYRTGDVVRWSNDGNLVYIGRNDDQVKLRGFRIELGEIDTQLTKLPGITNARTVIRKVAAVDSLVSYVVPESQQLDSVDEQLCRRALQQTLPDYMIPAAVVALPSLPLTSNGKLNVKALPEVEVSQSVKYEAAETVTEEMLQSIWQEILKQESVSVTANFFEIGGQSLLATRVVSEIARRCHKKVSVRAMFEYTNIRVMAKYIDSLSSDKESEIFKADRNVDIPLSFAQQRLWVLDQMAQGSSQYNMPAALSLKGELNIDALQFALDTIVQRHEVLRTRYKSQNRQQGDLNEGVVETANQVVYPASPVPLPVTDLSQKADGNEQVREYIRNEARLSFNLAEDLMLRCRLLKLSDVEHILLFTLHHIAADGWSLGILVKEFSELYQAHSNNRSAKLATLPMQYADFAAWQYSVEQSEQFEQSLSFWREELKDIPVLHNLPLDKSRPQIQRFDGAGFIQPLSAELGSKLKSLANEQGVSLFMLLHTAFALLLSRWSNDKDIVVGTPVAGRTRSEQEPLIGLFVNSLILRLKVAPELPFSELLAQNKTSILNAFAHQNVPFDRLVDELNPSRSLSHSPVFQILFGMQNNEQVDVELPGLDVATMSSDLTVVKTDLDVNVTETEHALLINWRYADSLFVSETIENMAASFEWLLTQITADVLQVNSAYSLLSPEQTERLSLLSGGIACDSIPSQLSNLTIYEVLERQARLTPDAIAVEAESHQGVTSVTFAQLLAAGQQLATLLQARGVQRGDFVGICTERSVDMMAAIVAVFKLGAVYVPMDPELPSERLNYIIQDSKVKLVVAEQLTAHKLPESAGPLLIDQELTQQTLWHENCDAIQLEAPVTCKARDLAYVIYTSGSTGNPKGVMVTHGQFLSTFNAMRQILDVNEQDQFPCLASQSFDISMLELFLPVLCGGTTQLIARKTVQQLNQLIALTRQATIFHAVPSLMQLWLEQVRIGDFRQLYPELRVVLVGGDAVPKSLIEDLMAYLPGVTVVELYGPTEAAILSSCYMPQVNPVDVPHCIGKPFGHVAMHILDEYGNPVPRGVVGELYICGPNVTSGYLNNPELTAEKFVAKPELGEFNSYRSGDLARYLPDGQIEFIGRGDNQVKVRGYRVELGEIEHCITSHPAVETALVLLDKSSGGEARILAFVTPVEKQNNDSSEEALKLNLTEHVATALPQYMLPNTFHVVASMPLTSNDKIDRKALLKMAAEQQSADYVAAESAMEIKLQAIWQTILQRENISVLDNFFEAGGNSLLATRLVSAISQQLHKDVSIKAIFEFPQIRALSHHLENLMSNTYLALEKRDSENLIPLSFSQQRLWFIDQMEGGSAQYNIPAAFMLRGEFNLSCFRQALNTMVERHEILRTTYQDWDGQAIQVINEEFEVPVIELPLGSQESQEVQIQRFINEEANRSFDLQKDVMLRSAYCAIAEQQHLILITTHHIASDGWSSGIFVKEFSAIYQALLKGQKPNLPPLKVQYADYAAWQRDTFDQQRLQQELQYWSQQLNGLPTVHSLPLDFARPKKQDYQSAQWQLQVDSELLQQLNTLAQSHGVSLFMLLQTAFALLLGKWSGETDIVVGSPVAGRLHKDVEPLIGFFNNNLVFRTKLDKQERFSELLSSSKQDILAAFEHQNVPFEMLVDELNPERTQQHSPLFQIKFVLQNMESGSLELSDSQLQPVQREQNVSHFDFDLTGIEFEQGLLLNWSYKTSLFRQSSIARMASGFESLLRSIVARPDGLLSEFAIQSEADAERMLKQGEGRHNSEGRQQTLVSCFEAQVAQTPDAVAVWYQEESGECSNLSYRDLNRYANQLADYLSEQGSGAGDFVAVYVSRSVELLVGLLGVLKAGAAYIPIEPSSKPARISQLLEDAGVELVLTSAGMLSGLPIASVDVLMLDDVVREGVLSDYADSNPEPVATLTDSAYVIYTSGSTGTPKGVEVSHGGLVDYLAFGLEAYYPTGGDGSLVVTSHGFDISIPGLFLPLMQGGCVRLLSVGDELNHLATELHQGDSHRYLIRMTPMHVKGLLSLMDADSTVTAEHVFVIGGEALSVRDARQLQARFPGSQIYNHYGPTETVVGCSLFDFSAQADNLDEGAVSVPIGRAMDNTRLYVLDSERQVCAEGMVGELYVGGPCVAKGYLNRPALTSERFIASPFVAGERLYRTGDLVRWQAGVSDAADSQLVFVGRADEQVKIRGYRIEPGEVSSLIKAHPGVSDAVVVVSGEGEQARLVAYVVSQEAEDESALIQGISHALGQVLPEHMIPSGMMLLAALPLTANGKLDRRGLPDIAQQSEQAYVAPRNELELQLAELWQSLLGVEQVGVNDNFFDLGGHSLLATRFIAVLRKELNVEFSIRQLFDAPTIAQLALLYQQYQDSQQVAKKPVEEDVTEEGWL